MENVDTMPLRPDNKKNIDAILDARIKLPPLNFGGAGIHSNVEVEGERRTDFDMGRQQPATHPRHATILTC